MTASLLIAPQWIGDAVMTEPLLRRLAARGERITVGALPWVAPVYRAMPDVAEVLEFPFAHGGLQWTARRDMARQLRDRFDVAYVCPNSFKSALVPWWAGIPVRIGYMGESRLGLLTQRLPNPPRDQRPPMVGHYAALSGETLATSDRPRLSLSESGSELALAALGLTAQGYYVFSPGAEYGPAKRWPASHFADLAASLPLPVVLLGSAKESALCADIAQHANATSAKAKHANTTGITGITGVERCIDLSGRTSLDQALAVIAHAKAMVSNDSGLMHVAAAFDVPQVALFGSSSPLHTPPLSQRSTVIWLRDDPSYQPVLDCAPCFARVCPLGHTRCLNDIAPERVRALL
jgi:heptosyltransferase-2